MEFDMVFEGGGAKGMVFVGAMRAFEERNHTTRRLVGTSAGAITATLMAAGYTAQEMEEALGEKDQKGQPLFAGFMDRPTAADFSQHDIDESVTMKMFRKIDIPLVPARAEEWADNKIIAQMMKLHAYPVLFSFIERGGLYVGKAFVDWFTNKLGKHNPAYSGMTLQAFHDATGRDLSLVATNTSREQLLVLNHRTAPNCPVVWAVRMSMSIPFAWQEVRWNAAWDPYRLYDAEGVAVASETRLANDAIVDGGVLSNFAIDKLISDEAAVRAVMGDTEPEPARVLGMLIDETLEVANAPPPPSKEEDDDKGVAGDIKKLRTVQRVSRLIDTMMGAHDKELIEVQNHLVCRMPAKGYGTMEFDMTDARKDALIAAGYSAMQAHLEGRGA